MLYKAISCVFFTSPLDILVQIKQTGRTFIQDDIKQTRKNNKYQLLYMYGVPPDDGL